MKFLIDNQLPPALARFIQADLGYSASHVADLELSDASDAQLWAHASEHGFILVSKDEDFTHLALHKPAAGLIWVRLGNCRRSFLLDVFRQIWPRVLARLESGDRFIEIR